MAARTISPKSACFPRPSPQRLSRRKARREDTGSALLKISPVPARRLLAAACLLLVCAPPCRAQLPSPPTLPPNNTPATPGTPAPSPAPAAPTVVPTGPNAMPTAIYVAPNAPVPPISLQADRQEDAPGLRQFRLDGNVQIVGGNEFVLRADSVTGDILSGIGEAQGNVSLRELDTGLSAQSFFYNRDQNLGLAETVILSQYHLTIAAQRVRERPGRIDATNARVTTCPPDDPAPDYYLRARSITISEAARTIIFRRVGLFLFGHRLVEVGRYALRYGRRSSGAAGPLETSQSFGYDGYNGPYATITTRSGTVQSGALASLLLPLKHTYQAELLGYARLLTGPRAQALPPPKPGLIGLVRQAAEANEPLLPAGDPLLFYGFLDRGPFNDIFDQPGNQYTLTATGAATYRERIFGRAIGDLFVSRSPEVGLYQYVPLGGPQDVPTDRDPIAVRRALRHLAIRGGITPTLGRYDEQPTGITRNRAAVTATLDARPLLIGDNTLFRPKITMFSAYYPSPAQSYRYIQYDLAVGKDYSPRTAVSMEYLGSSQSGRSPFNFDTPNVAEELDFRGQFGDRHIVLGVLVKYDLSHDHVFQEQLLFGKVLKCLIPKITYSPLSGTIGLGLEIEGLTF